MKKQWLILVGIVTLLIVTLLAGCAGQGPAPASPATSSAPAPAASSAAPTSKPTASSPAATTPVAAANTITLKTHSHMTADNIICVRALWWEDQVTQRSNGRVKFQNYYGESLVKSADQLSGLKSGLFDIGTINPQYWPSLLPLLNVTEQPWTITLDAAALNKAYADLVAKAPVQAELKTNNVHWFWGANPGGSRWIASTKKPIKVFDDLKGMKIRESGGYAVLLQKAGANPVSIAVPEVYDALSKGTLDGSAGPFSQMVSYAFYEVCKYYNLVALGAGEATWQMNLDSWNSLPPDVQKIMNDVSVDFSAYAGPAGTKDVADGLDFIKKKGVQVIDFPAEEQAKVTAIAEGISKTYATGLDGKGLPGTEMWTVFRDGLVKYSK